MGRNKIKYNIQTRYEEMENNDYISVSSCFRQVGIRYTRLTQQRNATTKKFFLKGLCVSFYTIMFFSNPLLSQQSQDDLILSSDIKLSKTELIQIKNKIEQERIVAPCWIHIGDKMYLIEKKQMERINEKQSKGTPSANQKHKH